MRDRDCPYVFNCKLGIAYKCPIINEECQHKVFYKDMDRRLQMGRLEAKNFRDITKELGVEL